MNNIQLILTACLLYFITASIAYEFSGLPATHYCQEHGETEECFRLMSMERNKQ